MSLLHNYHVRKWSIGCWSWSYLDYCVLYPDKLKFLPVHVMSIENDIPPLGGPDPEALGWIELPPAWLISSSRTSGPAAGGSSWASLMDGLRSPTKKAPSLPPFPLPPFLHLCTFVHSASVLRHDSNGSAASKETFCFIVFLKCVRTATARTTPFLYWLKTFANQHTTSSQKNQPASPEGGGGLGQKESAQSCRDFSSRYTWIHLDWQMIYRVHSMFLSKECSSHTHTHNSLPWSAPFFVDPTSPSSSRWPVTFHHSYPSVFRGKDDGVNWRKEGRQQASPSQSRGKKKISPVENLLTLN